MRFDFTHTLSLRRPLVFDAPGMDRRFAAIVHASLAGLAAEALASFSRGDLGLLNRVPQMHGRGASHERSFPLNLTRTDGLVSIEPEQRPGVECAQTSPLRRKFKC